MESAAGVVRRAPLLPFFPLLVLLLAASCAAQEPQPIVFQCSSATRCPALADYVTNNETTYEAIKILFQVKSARALYGANNLPTSTAASDKVPAGTTIRVPFPCACANGTGVSDGRPVYTVKKGDILYEIANTIFKGFVTYPQIAAASDVKNLSLIEVGQQLRIPLPCSCDPVDGAEVVHLIHVVAKGSSLEGIAGQAGTTVETLARINNISDPMSLNEGQVLDVPLRACNSSLRSDGDHSLRVPNGSYALTAENCVKCSCNSSSSWRLQCEVTQDVHSSNSSQCPAPQTCSGANTTGGQIELGHEVVNGCVTTRCEYAGYTNATILALPMIDQSACGGPGSGAPALRPLLLGP